MAEEDQQTTGWLLCSPLITSKWIVCVIYSPFFFSFHCLFFFFFFFFFFFYQGKRERTTAGGVSFVAVEEESKKRRMAAGNGPKMFELSIVRAALVADTATI